MTLNLSARHVRRTAAAGQLEVERGGVCCVGEGREVGVGTLGQSKYTAARS